MTGIRWKNLRTQEHFLNSHSLKNQQQKNQQLNNQTIKAIRLKKVQVMMCPSKMKRFKLNQKNPLWSLNNRKICRKDRKQKI